MPLKPFAGTQAVAARPSTITSWSRSGSFITYRSSARPQRGSNSDGDPAQRLPLRGIIGMRNVLVHGYFQVDDDLVWAVVEKELDPLAAHLKELLSS